MAQRNAQPTDYNNSELTHTRAYLLCKHEWPIYRIILKKTKNKDKKQKK